jgi:hypothetical protein
VADRSPRFILNRRPVNNVLRYGAGLARVQCEPHGENEVRYESTPSLFSRLAALAAVSIAPLAAEQSYVGRWDVYGGFANIERPRINLSEQGFNFQAAFRPETWITIGFDYTVAEGRTTLQAGMLITSLETRLAQQLQALEAAGLAPPGYVLRVPTNLRTQTFQFGPDFPFRHFAAVTFFVRPNLGAIQAVATPRPPDPIATAIVAQLIPSGKKTDWTYFYGFGGGFEFNVTRHFALRFQADFAHDQIFNDILQPGNSVRFSVGPALQWGKNVARK